MDVETGAILAWQIWATEAEDMMKIIIMQLVFLLNRSTFQAGSVMALFEDDGADLETPVDLGGGNGKFFDRLMHDSKEHGHS
jgi:hypothetical protein